LNEFKSANDNVSAIAVVFDAKGGQSSIRGFGTSMGIELVYATQEETADDVIMEMVAKRKGKARDHLVVSSDNRITNFAAANSMNIMSSDAFAEYLEE
jgi:predicted RNA-binding protein with PIN domain